MDLDMLKDRSLIFATCKHKQSVRKGPRTTRKGQIACELAVVVRGQSQRGVKRIMLVWRQEKSINASENSVHAGVGVL
jgi:hypothetical protein